MTQSAIFITGAAKGIGRATAEYFAQRGWRVGVYDVNESGIQELVRQLGPDRAMGGVLDVCDAAACQRALEAFCKSTGGRLDVMFNNAGIASVDKFENVAIAKAHAIVDINLKGVINGCYAALPHLQRTLGSALINMSSASAIYGAPNLAVYSATKFAVKGLTEALDIEWHGYGIRVMDIGPLFVNTPMVAQFENNPKSFQKLGLHLQPEDIAEAVWKAAHSRGLLTPVHWYPGLQTRLLALMSKLSPAWLNRLSNRLIQG